MPFVARLIADDRGQDLVEYALLLGMITVAAVAAVTGLGSAAISRFTAATTALAPAP